MAKQKTKQNKKSKFRLMRMHQIKIFYIFVPNLGEIYLFGKKKIGFSEKLRPILRHGSLKTDLTVKNGDFLVKLGSERVNQTERCNSVIKTAYSIM